jgi:hypothetical protein
MGTGALARPSRAQLGSGCGHSIPWVRHDHTGDMTHSTVPNANRGIKRRRTFTLSPESLAYLDEQARQRKLGSQSAFLDELLREKTMEMRRAALEANATAYYDSLSEEERQEQPAWGELAEQSLALREDGASYDQPTARGNLVHPVPNRPSGKRKAPGRHRPNQRSKQSSAR